MKIKKRLAKIVILSLSVVGGGLFAISHIPTKVEKDIADKQNTAVCVVDSVVTFTAEKYNEYAKHDIVVVDGFALFDNVAHPEYSGLVDSLRLRNPDIVVLGYMPSFEIKDTFASAEAGTIEKTYATRLFKNGLFARTTPVTTITPNDSIFDHWDITPNDSIFDHWDITENDSILCEPVTEDSLLCYVPPDSVAVLAYVPPDSVAVLAYAPPDTVVTPADTLSLRKNYYALKIQDSRVQNAVKDLLIAAILSDNNTNKKTGVGVLWAGMEDTVTNARLEPKGATWTSNMTGYADFDSNGTRYTEDSAEIAAVHAGLDSLIIKVKAEMPAYFIQLAEGNLPVVDTAVAANLSGVFMSRFNHRYTKTATPFKTAMASTGTKSFAVQKTNFLTDPDVGTPFIVVEPDTFYNTSRYVNVLGLLFDHVYSVSESDVGGRQYVPVESYLDFGNQIAVSNYADSGDSLYHYYTNGTVAIDAGVGSYAGGPFKFSAVRENGYKKTNTEAAVSSASGTFVDGNTITINGSNFGTKTTVAPVIWETFEGYSDGDTLAGTSGWVSSQYAGVADALKPVATTDALFARGKSLVVGKFVNDTAEWDIANHEAVQNAPYIGKTGLTGLTDCRTIYINLWLCETSGAWTTKSSYNSALHAYTYPSKTSAYFILGNGNPLCGSTDEVNMTTGKPATHPRLYLKQTAPAISPSTGALETSGNEVDTYNLAELVACAPDTVVSILPNVFKRMTGPPITPESMKFPAGKTQTNAANFGHWVNIEVELDPGSNTYGGPYNGSIKYWVLDGNTQRQNAVKIDLPNSQKWFYRADNDKFTSFYIGQLLDAITSGTSVVYYDNVYVDKYWSRVYAGNSDAFATCTHLEIQKPITWSDTRVTFEFIQGSFEDGEIIYFYIINQYGQVSKANIAAHPRKEGLKMELPQ